MPQKKKISVLFVGAELAPLVKVGGLGDVMGALPKSLAKLGVDIKIIIPFYGNIDPVKYKMTKVSRHMMVKSAGVKERFSLYQAILPDSKIPVYLIKHRLFNSQNIYFGSRKYLKNGVYTRTYVDVERFAIFTQAVAEVIYTKRWSIDIVHHHDWHTALLPTYIDEYSIRHTDFPNIKTLYTIHNLANQGVAGLDILDYASLHHDLTPALMEDYYDKDGRVIDLMKIGILSADYINTVSPTYAREILTKEYGEDLEQYLRRRKNNLVGILNGIDTSVFEPKTDKFIFKKFSVASVLAAKQFNKSRLQAKLKLPVADSPLYGIVTRLVDQKGFDILLPAVEKILVDKNWQLVILGTGQKFIENKIKVLAQKHPNQIRAVIGFDLALAQQIYAASDFFLMPSSFEPCGLGQMIAMRYGSLPIVRATGGLADTVKNNKNGLVFKKYTTGELAKIWQKSGKLYKNKAKMKTMVETAMQADWSWRKSAQSYIALYKKLLK